MLIKIKRYHLILAICFLILLKVAGIFSRESAPTLKEAIPPVLKTIEKNTAPADTENKKSLPIQISQNLPAKNEGLLPVKKISEKSTSTTFSAGEAFTKEKKAIALTFDDGPHPIYTEQLLKILREQNVPATFFVVGKQVELHPDLLQKIFREGHELANHTYSHRDLRTLSSKEFEDEIGKTHKMVELITDQQMKFFRPPGGQYNQEVIERGKSMGYSMTLWTILPRDHSNPSAQFIRSHVLKTAQKNGVILLHSGIANTISALPDLIVELKKRSYSFVTLSQMDSSLQPPSSLTASAK